MSIFLDPEILILLATMACLLVGSGLCSASEAALFFLSQEELQAFQRSSKPSEQRVVALLKDSDLLLTALLFWNLVINLSIFAMGVVISERLVAKDQRAAAGALGIVTLVAVISFGEVLPKTTAVLFRKSFARLVSLPISLMVRSFVPFSPAFKALTRSLRRMFWPDVEKEKYISPEDLEQAIDNTEADSVVVHQERQVLHNILDISEIAVEEIMRPRGSYQTHVPPIRAAQLHLRDEHCDYLIVASPNSEDIDGVVTLATVVSLPTEHIESVAEPVIHVPWCAKVANVLQKMEDDGCSLASVLNEFGETIGIVTYDDIIDTILASDPSKGRRLMHREPILEIAPGRLHVDGITSLRFLSHRLNIDYDHDEEEHVTVAGLFHQQLERIPEVGDQCHWRGFELRVIESPRRGFIRVLIAPHEPSE